MENNKQQTSNVQNTQRNNMNTTTNENSSNQGTTGYKGKKNFFKNKNFFFSKKECFLKKNQITYVDFKDVGLLKRFIKKSGQIISNRVTGATNINQRKIAKAIKRARYMGLLPFKGIIEDMQFNPNRRDREQNYKKPDTTNAPESPSVSTDQENVVNTNPSNLKKTETSNATATAVKEEKSSDNSTKEQH